MVDDGFFSARNVQKAVSWLAVYLAQALAHWLIAGHPLTDTQIVCCLTHFKFDYIVNLIIFCVSQWEATRWGAQLAARAALT